MTRPRIKKKVEDIEIVDPLEFKSNCASENAQLIHVYDELEVELWCDKHYHQRRTFGDNKGKREGIEIDGVQGLIIVGFKCLLDIHLRGIPFKFINYFDVKDPKKEFHRIVLKKILDNGTLNVVCEIHYLDTSKFEITVITAMVVDNFNLSEGQYSLTVSEKRATLSRNIRKSLNEIYKINF